MVICPKVLAAPAGFNGCIAYAALIYATNHAKESLELARSLLTTQPDNIYCAATCVGGVLVVRWLARDALLLRNGYGAFWAAFRQQVAGLPPTLPRLWFV